VGDLAVGFSFSGSPNILTALRMAIARKAKMILMTSQKSFDQNYMKEEGLEFIAHFILVPSDDIQVVEDVWSSICHMICNEVRKLKSGAQSEGD
jgi:phosphoheptose isomerase